MCWCNPLLRTPNCGKATCVPPSTHTASNATMAVPTAEGQTDGVKALLAACQAGKWTLLAPDGRVWMEKDPMILFAVLAQVMQGRELRFGEH